MASILEAIRSWIGTDPDEMVDYEVEAYVLERRVPDPNPRVVTYDDVLSPEEVREREELQDGEYLLQELKSTGTVGAVVWEAELSFSD